jgi:hypothetical protein
MPAFFNGGFAGDFTGWTTVGGLAGTGYGLDGHSHFGTTAVFFCRYIPLRHDLAKHHWADCWQDYTVDFWLSNALAGEYGFQALLALTSCLI